LGVLTAFLMLMMMVSIIGDYGILSSHQLQERKEILEQNIKDLKNKEMLMREEIHALKNSPTFIAEVDSSELGWIKENERVYFFNQEKKSL
ncbi:MAG: septum formation initiator family protein, partial [SAR324 cluster bacterium]|nr:septum formation initiator family protein [SAR324 cluster bacterium]